MSFQLKHVHGGESAEVVNNYEEVHGVTEHSSASDEMRREVIVANQES